MQVQHHQTATLTEDEIKLAIREYLHRSGFVANADPDLKAKTEAGGQTWSSGTPHQSLVASVEGHEIDLSNDPAPMRVYAIGTTPEEAILSRWPDAEGFDDLPGDTLDWGRRFRACEGTGFKAGGMTVSGGVVVTWWK